MKVLVTGGAGYIGSHTCEVLADHGHEPIVFDNLSIGSRWAVRWGPLEYGDLLDAGRVQEVVARHRPDAVLHFAALALVGESVADPAKYFKTNVSGTINLLDACVTHGVNNVVFSSTCSIFGNAEAMPLTEQSPKQPINPYAESKLMIERIIAEYARAYSMRYAALRYFNAAGASSSGLIGELREVETHLIPLALDSLTGLRPPIKVFGDDYPTPDGTPIRDYIHVCDLAEAHVRVLERVADGEPSMALNLGSGSGYSVKQVLDTIEKVTGKQVPFEMGERRSGDPAMLVADPALALGKLGDDVLRRSTLESIVESAWRWHANGRYASLFSGF